MESLLPRPFRVERVRRETHDVSTLELRGGPLRFAAGQFTMAYAFGVGEIPLSISGDPAQPDVLVHSIRAVGPVSRAIAGLKKGDVLGIRGPYGAGWPVGSAEGGDVVVVAGGMGLAPLRPVVYTLLARRKRFRRVSLLYGARSPEDVVFARELRRWKLDVEITVDRAATRGWRDHVGTVTTLIPHAAFEAASTTAFICGPEIMMRFTAQALADRGVPAARIFVSAERNMKCAVGFCGHCQLGPRFICKDGPVFPWAELCPLLSTREL